jgi:hypothetical protein
MGEVSKSDSMDRERRIALLSGVSEVTRSERHQCPDLVGRRPSPHQGSANKETKWHGRGRESDRIIIALMAETTELCRSEGS